MAKQISRFYFGRLNIIATYPNSKKEFLSQGLMAKSLISKHNLTFEFFEIQDNIEEYLYGYLVKYSSNEQEEIVNPETREFELQDIENKIRAKSLFFLDIKSGIIAYQVTGHFHQNSFTKYFAKLFMASYDNFFVDAEIQPIGNEHSFFEAVDRLTMIKSIQISLHPSNPFHRDLWKRTDERLHSLGVESYQELFRFKNTSSQGNNIQKDEELNGKMYMAEDGYGKAIVKGEINGIEEVIRTGEAPVEALVEIPSDPSHSTDVFENILSNLRPTFKAIFKRIKN